MVPGMGGEGGRGGKEPSLGCQSYVGPAGFLCPHKGLRLGTLGNLSPLHCSARMFWLDRLEVGTICLIVFKICLFKLSGWGPAVCNGEQEVQGRLGGRSKRGSLPWKCKGHQGMW